MKLLQPVHGIGNEKRVDLVTAEIEDVGSPIDVFPLSRILMLVLRMSIESRKPVGVAGEMRRHPIKNYADTGLV